MTAPTAANLYDHPKYYDLLFGSDWKAEFDFLTGCFERYARCEVRRIFEPACGTGRLLIKLAKAGYEVAGNDLNRKAVDYCNRRLVRHGFAPTVSVGDMADFTVRRKFQAAFNTINSFRHLDSEAAAESHLHCVGRAISTGGLYVLGLHLIPAGKDRIDHEEWTARRGHLQVNSRMWTKDLNLRARNEKLGMTFDVYTPTRHLQLVDEMNYRTYTRSQFAALLGRCPEFEVAGVHDFAYDLEHQVEITAETEDVVFVLRKVSGR